MIIVDTSALIDSLVGERRSAARMRALIEAAERLVLPTIVLYEWWRGPRQSEELAAQEALFPSEAALPFGVQQAEVAAGLYRAVGRARGREVDLAIAAHAISRDAMLWTLSTGDFEDIPGLKTVAIERALADERSTGDTLARLDALEASTGDIEPMTSET